MMEKGKALNFDVLADFAIKEARTRGADFLTFIYVDGHTLRNRVIAGEVRQPKEVKDAGVELVVFKNGRVMTCEAYPNREQISEALNYALRVLDSKEFSQSDLIPPEGPYKTLHESLSGYDSATAELSSQKAEGYIRTVKEALAASDLIFDGVFTQGVSTLMIAASHGTRQLYTSTRAGLSVYAFDRNEALAAKGGQARIVSAFSYGGGHGLADINPEKLAREVITKCRLQRNWIKWNPHKYFSSFTGEQYFDVIVEPPFIGPVLEWLFGFGGFNGKFFLQGESFLSGKLGEQVFGKNITIWDDPFYLWGIFKPFDWEGVPKKKILLAEQGVIKNICYDSSLAKKAGARSTGHAIPASAAMQWGAMPGNVYIEGDDYSIEDMIRASIWPTIWITKVHYIGLKHFQTGTLTGTAQHGVFLVANGEVVGPVENLRFEMEIPEALRRVTHLGKPQLIGGVLGSDSPFVIPPMRIEGFRFIGATGRTV